MSSFLNPDSELSGKKIMDNWFGAPIWQEIVDDDFTFLVESFVGIMSRSYWEDFKTRVDAFYAQTSDAQIEEYNTRPREKRTGRHATRVAVEPQKYPGFIYLMHAEQTPWYKIGRGVNPKARRTEFNTQAPYRCVIIHTFAMEDTVRMEAALHKHFKHLRGRGEWFTLSEEDVAFIQGLTETTAPQWLEQQKTGRMLALSLPPDERGTV